MPAAGFHPTQVPLRPASPEQGGHPGVSRVGAAGPGAFVSPAFVILPPPRLEAGASGQRADGCGANVKRSPPPAAPSTALCQPGWPSQ